MSVENKYQDVLNLGKELNVANMEVCVENEVLNLKGEAKTPYEKNILWDTIKACAGENAPKDIMADITVADDSVYHVHEVVSGDTLGKIAKHYFKDPSKYKQIFAANTDILNNPDMIQVGQAIKIPNL